MTYSVRSESSGLKVAARLSPPLSTMMRSSAGEVVHERVDGREVHRRIFADRGVRAAAGLDAADALRRQRLAANQEFLVFLGVDVVGDDGDVERVAHALAQ